VARRIVCFRARLLVGLAEHPVQVVDLADQAGTHVGAIGRYQLRDRVLDALAPIDIGDTRLQFRLQGRRLASCRIE
jgi:hypothetical protein